MPATSSGRPGRVGAARLDLALDARRGRASKEPVPVEALGDPRVGLGVGRWRGRLLDRVADPQPEPGRARAERRRDRAGPPGSAANVAPRRDAMRAARASGTLPRPMRVLILGGDGYLGWPTALRFSARGHEVSVVDNFVRRRWVEGVGSDSLTPILDLDARIAAWARDVGQRDPQLRRRRSRTASSSSRSSPRPVPRRSSTTASRRRRPTRWPRASRRSRPSTAT